MRVSVSIDRAEPVVCQMKEIFNSKEWKFDHWRGQSLKNFYVTLSSGNHTIEIKALDDNVIIDQWVVDLMWIENIMYSQYRDKCKPLLQSRGFFYGLGLPQMMTRACHK